VVGRALEPHSRVEDATHRRGERASVRVEDREVIQAGGPWRRARCSPPCPRVEPDVVMIAAGREKHSGSPVSAGHLEPEHVPVEGKGAVQVGDGQMDVTDVGAGVDSHQSLNVSVFPTLGRYALRHDLSTYNVPS